MRAIHSDKLPSKWKIKETATFKNDDNSQSYRVDKSVWAVEFSQWFLTN